MPVSIVVGGQFGSEGKGKVALEIVRRTKQRVSVVRVGGPNSGHTAYDRAGKKWALRQMPAACVDKNVDVIFPAGSYLDLEVLFREIDELDYPRDRIFVSPYANIIMEQHRNWEADSELVGSIGSTGSGVGAAVMAAIARGASTFPLRAMHAQEDGRLQKYVTNTSEFLSRRLDREERVVIEGSQGFGLSLLDGGYWPKATSRVTTAAGALAEAGLSPLHVDDVTLVLRAFPIRVAGESGPLVGETTWESIAQRCDREDDLREYTTVTQKLRRVGEFDSKLVIRAIESNSPNRLVLNHLDYVGPKRDLVNPDSSLSQFLQSVRQQLPIEISWLGFSGYEVIEPQKVSS